MSPCVVVLYDVVLVSLVNPVSLYPASSLLLQLILSLFQPSVVILLLFSLHK